MFALIVRFEVHPDHINSFDKLVSETLAEIQAKESETVAYMSHRNRDHPNERIFYECYRDITAFAAHEEQVHIRRFLNERSQHLAREPEVWRLEPINGAIDGKNLGSYA